jgi:hypothetical protein
VAAELRFLEVAFAPRSHPRGVDPELVVRELRRVRKSLTGNLESLDEAS